MFGGIEHDNWPTSGFCQFHKISRWWWCGRAGVGTRERGHWKCLFSRCIAGGWVMDYDSMRVSAIYICMYVGTIMCASNEVFYFPLLGNCRVSCPHWSSHSGSWNLENIFATYFSFKVGMDRLSLASGECILRRVICEWSTCQLKQPLTADSAFWITHDHTKDKIRLDIVAVIRSSRSDKLAKIRSEDLITRSNQIFYLIMHHHPLFTPSDESSTL
jgi:hypothetical protein